MLLTVVLVALIGILVGGVINVLADDLPEDRAIRLPPRLAWPRGSWPADSRITVTARQAS